MVFKGFHLFDQSTSLCVIALSPACPFLTQTECNSFMFLLPCANDHLLCGLLRVTQHAKQPVRFQLQDLKWWTCCTVVVWQDDGLDCRVEQKKLHRKMPSPDKRVRFSVSLWSVIHGGGPLTQHEIKLSSNCWLCTTVKLERNKQCLGGRVHSCGLNSGLWGFVS